MLIHLANGRWVDHSDITGIHVAPNRNDKEKDTPWVAVFMIQKKFTSYTRHATEADAKEYADHIGSLCSHHALSDTTQEERA